MSNLKLTIGQKLLGMFGVLALVAVLTGVLSTMQTLSVGSRGLDTATKVAPLGDAAMEIKLTATHGHLVFEEIMGGDATEDIQVVWDLFAETQFYADAILNGGENDEGKFYPTTNPKVRVAVERVKQDIAELIVLAHQRYDNRGTDQVGSTVETQFDETFEKIIIDADEAEEYFHDGMDEDVDGMEQGQINAVILVGFGSAASLVLALGSFLFSKRYISQRLAELTAATTGLAEGQVDVDIPDWKSTDELGAMRDSLLTFREALREREKLQSTSDQNSRDVAARAANSQRLNQAIGAVVDAAVAGNFSQRVDGDFSDAELNNLAASVNNLVETVDRGMAETGDVLAALADTDLTQRVNGDY